MPNICNATINIRGYAGNVDEFIKILEANYNYISSKDNNKWEANKDNFSHIPHFFRVFDVVLTDENNISGVYKCTQVYIECAWSVYVCLFNGPMTYFEDYERDHKGQHYATNILRESKRLGLEIEIWSREYGMMFQEHYKICSGVLVKNEEHSYDVQYVDNYNDYMSIRDDFPAVEPYIITGRDFEEYLNSCDDGECPIYINLAYEENDFEVMDEPVYLANLVMVKSIDK